LTEFVHVTRAEHRPFAQSSAEDVLLEELVLLLPPQPTAATAAVRTTRASVSRISIPPACREERVTASPPGDETPST
jgi:hypothetical protein